MSPERALPGRARRADWRAGGSSTSRRPCGWGADHRPGPQAGGQLTPAPLACGQDVGARRRPGREVAGAASEGPLPRAAGGGGRGLRAGPGARTRQQRERRRAPRQAQGAPSARRSPPLPPSPSLPFWKRGPRRDAQSGLRSSAAGAPAPRGAAPGGAGGGAAGIAALSLRWGEGAGGGQAPPPATVGCVPANGEPGGGRSLVAAA